MGGAPVLRPEPGAGTAGLRYTVDTGVKPVNETFGPNNIRRRVSGEHEVRQMTIRNGRPLAGELDLEVTGFEFVDHKTRVHDFFDLEELKRVYYPEVEALVKKVSGASRVVVFDHTLRSGDEADVFKVYDSAKDGRARFTAHSSFVDPTTPPGAPPRQSIEARTLAFFARA